jgi:hypothetical protein
MIMKNDNYPNLYRCADAASLKAQHAYFLFQKVYLGTLVLGAVISVSMSMGSPAVNKWLYTTLSVVLMVGLVILWVMRARQDDKIWFDGRAVAESAKTATWRYMMGVRPFRDNADAAFISHLKEIRNARPHLGKFLTAAMDADGSMITDFMKAKRSASLQERQAFYTGSRIRDQKVWYRDNANANLARGSRWFWTIAVLQVVVVIIAMVQAVSGGWAINPTPIITTFAAAMAAWSQMKRHEELAQAYALAAQELEEIETIADNPAFTDQFSQLVEQAENSISREHTMWCARRDVRLTKMAGPTPTTLA